jgi:hypothetical protein
MEHPVNTLNDFAVGAGENLPNHAQSLKGRGKFVRAAIPTVPLIFRTRQEVFRFCAYALAMADTLPDEPGEHDFETVQTAILNT